MVNEAISKQLVQTLDRLPDNQQKKVLAFAKSLNGGARGKSLLRFAGSISRKDAKAMREVIEAGCERVDKNEW